MFNACDRTGLEGIISKKISSRYYSGKVRSWLKVKCWAEGEFLVIGVEPASDGPAVALLAHETAIGFEYAGGASVTLAQPDRERFWREAERLERSYPAVPCASKKAQWVEPQLSVRARYLKGEGKLRHATISALA